MKNLTFQRLWEENKKFLLIAGSALLVFLILRSLVVSYELRATGHSGTLARNLQLEGEFSRRLRPVKQRFNNERELFQDYAGIERDLLERHALALPRELKLSGKEKEVFFTERIDGIWGEVLPKARRINCELPNKISIRDLGLHPDDRLEDLRSHALYLTILRRALHVLVDSGMKKISAPRLQREELLDVKGNLEYGVVFWRIDFKVQGPYRSFVDVLRRCQQKPGAFLQAILRDLDPRRAGPNMLNGTIQFSGFDIEGVKDDGGDARSES